MFFRKKILTEMEFTKQYAKQLEKRKVSSEIKIIDALEIVGKKANSEEIRHFLDNCYSEYCQEPKRMDEIISKYVAATEAIYLEDEKVLVERIIPIIKNHRFIDSLKDLGADSESNHVYEKYNEELYVFYAEDTDLNIKYLTKDDFQKLEISLEELKEIALENLSNLVAIQSHGESGYYMLTCGGSYESSLILLNIWEKENFDVNGEFVVGIPSRDLLLITGNKDSENRHKIFDVVQDISSNGDHLVSDKLFEFVNGKFELLKM